MKKRLDQSLYERGMVRSRSEASDLISRSKVLVNKKLIKKPSFQVEQSDELELVDYISYVGRGAEKIAGVIENFKISLAGKVVCDVGACTGGFSDYALKNGAIKSYAIDVGHDQLAKELREDSRVINLEGTNVRNVEKIEKYFFLSDLVMIDLSHISQVHTLQNCQSLMKKKGQMISLFKPQFEVGKSSLGKGGIVSDKKAIAKSLDEFSEFSKTLGLVLVERFECCLKGKKGNQEYFLLFKNK